MHVCNYVQLIDWAFPPILDAELHPISSGKNACVHPVFTVTNELQLYIHIYVVLYFGMSASKLIQKGVNLRE